MSPTDPITHWIDQLKEGNAEAVPPLLQRYFHQLVRLARDRLRAAPRGAIDEEDVALSAFASFCRAAEEARLPKLTDRDSLWSHLFMYTIRKAHNQIRRERAQIRGGGNVVTASALDGPGGEPWLLDVLGREPTPEMAALLEEDYRLLLDRLPNAELRAVARWKFEGDTNDEIAAKLGCVTRSVDRKLGLIRDCWRKGDQS